MLHGESPSELNLDACRPSPPCPAPTPQPDVTGQGVLGLGLEELAVGF